MSLLSDDLIKYTPRKEQQNALDFIKSHKTDPNNTTKFFLMDIPTGIGKSHLSMMISDFYLREVNSLSKVDIITAGKILQDQYGSTYGSLSNLKGMDNYECKSYSTSCLNGKEFNKLNKTTCDFCPYEISKNKYLSGPISLTNFQLYLIYSIRKAKEEGYANVDVKEKRLLIVDEAHNLHDVMSDFISVKITDSSISKLNLSNEYEVAKKFKSVSSIEKFVEFLKYLVDEMNETSNRINESMSSSDRSVISDKRDLKVSKIVGGEKNSDMKSMAVLQEIIQQKTKIDFLLSEYTGNKNNWIMESSYNENLKQKEMSIEPIWASNFLEKFVWSKYDMVILMSGTILDKKLFSDINSIDETKSVYYSIESPFPSKNRKIYYMPIGKMSYDKKINTFKKCVPYIEKILKKYKDVKGVIHTNSFELSNWIKRDVSNNRLIFHETSDRDDKLRMHMESSKPLVFVSPSVDTGVSFDGDKSRFQVIAKIPYPSLASKKNQVRLKNNPNWYAYKAVSGVIQMCGRSVRSRLDYADTIIIDASFSDLLRYNSHMFPDWFQRSIKKVDVN